MVEVQTRGLLGDDGLGVGDSTGKITRLEMVRPAAENDVDKLTSFRPGEIGRRRESGWPRRDVGAN